MNTIELITTQLQNNTNLFAKAALAAIENRIEEAEDLLQQSHTTSFDYTSMSAEDIEAQVAKQPAELLSIAEAIKDLLHSNQLPEQQLQLSAAFNILRADVSAAQQSLGACKIDYSKPFEMSEEEFLAALK